MLVIPPILGEPFQPVNLVKRSALSVLQGVKQCTDLERHEFQVWALTEVRGSFDSKATSPLLSVIERPRILFVTPGNPNGPRLKEPFERFLE
jgi:hypothetical protein